jgi:phosphoglycolate phosphatase
LNDGMTSDGMPMRPPAAWRGRLLRGVLFDLDGTLLDTAADIADALNRSFSERGWQPLPVSVVSRMIGRGSPILITRAAESLGHTLTAAEQSILLERFFEHYGAHEEAGESAATPYPGVTQTLRTLHDAGLKIAVVTNKQRRFADALLQRLELMPSIDLVVGGDTCERRKPDPQPLLFACESLGISPGEAMMVGDSVNDVTAARAAHIPVVCVPYGYNEGQDPKSLQCDVMLDTLADLPGMFWSQSGPAGSSRTS